MWGTWGICCDFKCDFICGGGVFVPDWVGCKYMHLGRLDGHDGLKTGGNRSVEFWVQGLDMF